MATQASFLTLRVKFTHPIGCVNERDASEFRHEENKHNVGRGELASLRLIPGDHEKGMMKKPKDPYQEPALVPLGEKPKV